MTIAAAAARPSASPALLLLVWTSPAFPVGAYAYSHAIEWAVERADIRDADTLRDWLADLLAHGTIRNDAVLLRAAWDAGLSLDGNGLHQANQLALALASSRERHLEASAQGNAFLTATLAAWPCPALDCLRAAVAGDIAYPIAFATAAAGHEVSLGETLEAFCLAVVANLISAAIRLGAIGQTDGQRVTAALMGSVRALAAFAATATLDDLGGAAFRSDLAALQHETQYSRLFRS